MAATAKSRDEVVVDPFSVDGVDALYERPPSEFIAARDAIVKQLKIEQRKSAAEAVKALRRPTVLGWAVNQVARTEPALLHDLRVRGRRGSKGTGPPLDGKRDDLRTAVQHHRKVVGDMAAKAAALVGAQYRDEAAATFEAASIDEQAFDALAEGRLTGELERNADLAFAGMPTTPRPKKASKPASKPSRKDTDRRKRDIAQAEAAVRSAEDGVRRADSRVRATRSAMSRRQRHGSSRRAPSSSVCGRRPTDAFPGLTPRRGHRRRNEPHRRAVDVLQVDDPSLVEGHHPTAAVAVMVLFVAEPGAPARGLQRAPTPLRRVNTAEGGGSHGSIVHAAACGSSVPITCDFPVDSREMRDSDRAAQSVHRTPAGSQLRRSARRRPTCRATRLRRVLPQRSLPEDGVTWRWTARAVRRLDHAGRHRGETTTIRLGTLVSSATFRLPGMLAVEVANVDHMSSGRVELGLGAGWFLDEHRSYAVPFPPLGERFERLKEQLAVITGLWETPPGERFQFDGRHYQVADSPALPKPMQSPLPIIIGGSGARRTPALAARYAQEFNLPFQSRQRFIEQCGRVRVACETIGRDPGSLVYSCAQVVCVGRDEAELARRAEAIGREVDDLRANDVCGTPAEAVERLRLWSAEGASRVYLQVLDLADLDHLDLIAAEVMPHV